MTTTTTIFGRITRSIKRSIKARRQNRRITLKTELTVHIPPFLKLQFSYLSEPRELANDNKRRKRGAV